jgi:hypothetical protein
MTTKRFQQKIISTRLAIFATLLILVFPSITMAAQVTLAWDQNTNPVDGYTVYQRVGNKAYNYSSPVWPKDGNKQTNKLTCTLSGLTQGQTYYFVVRAHYEKVASGDSNEVSFKVPVSQVTTHTITVSSGANGKISPSGKTTVSHGGSQTYYFTPNTGFKVSKVTVDGQSLGVLTKYTFSNVTKNHSVYVQFAAVKTTNYSPAAADQNGYYQQSSNGIVSIDAAKCSANLSGRTHKWKKVKPSDHTGSGAMQAIPDSGKIYKLRSDTTDSPRLDYKVNFTQTGTYYVQVRGKGKFRGRSLHMGLNGVALATADRIAYFSGNDWIYSGKTLNNKAAATIKIPKGGEGIHTINVWMREDGMMIDQIILTPSENHDPNKVKVEIVTDPSSNSENVYDYTDTGSENASDTDSDNPPVNDDSRPTTEDYQDYTFQQNPNGIVSIEAENYTTDTTTETHSWHLVIPPSNNKNPKMGCSGDGAMLAAPYKPNPKKKHTNINTGYTTKSPCLKYKVNFTKSGTYYFWVRGKGEPKGRSLHAGLNGIAQATADRIAYFPGNNWIWSRKTMDNEAAATIKIPKGREGIHTINVWMREDGMMIDKIVLTTSRNYVPKGSGPNESEISR